MVLSCALLMVTGSAILAPALIIVVLSWDVLTCCLSNSLRKITKTRTAAMQLLNLQLHAWTEMGSLELCSGRLLRACLSHNPTKGLEGDESEGEEKTDIFLRLVSDYSVWFKHLLMQLWRATVPLEKRMPVQSMTLQGQDLAFFQLELLHN